MSLAKLAIAVPLALALAACGGKEERAKAHLDRGKNLFAAAEYEKAGVEIRNVLQIDPRSADAYRLAAQIWERQSDFQRSFAAYSKAAELEPSDLDAKAAVARFYLFGGAPDKARVAVEEILAADPQHPGGRTVHAALLARDDKRKEAIAEARAVLESHPGHIEASGLLASLLAGSDAADAEAVLVTAAGHHPRDIGVRLALASLYERDKHPDKAETRLREVIQLAPSKPEYRAALAAFLTRSGAPERAEIVLREAMQAAPGEDRPALALVGHLASYRGFEAAERELRGLIDARPKAVELRFALASLLLESRRTEEAMQVYRSLVAAERVHPAGLRARDALARVLIAESRPAEADPLITEVLAENPRDNAALLLRAQRSLEREDPTSAIVDLRAVLRDQPDSLELTALLARAHLAQKEPGLAREVLGRAVAINAGRPAFRYLYVSFLSSQGEHEAALREIDDLLRERPGDAASLQAKAQVQFAAGQHGSAETTLKQLIASSPQSPVGHFRLAQLYVAEQKSAAALQELETAAAQAPSDVEVLGAIVKLMLAQKNEAGATARLKKAQAFQPDNPLIAVMLGELLSAQRKYAEAAPLFRKAAELEPRLEPARTNLVLLRLAQGDLDAALQEARRGVESQPRSTRYGVLLAEVLQRRGEYREAMARYEAILKLAPGNDVAANNFAALAADYADEPAVLKRALALAKRFERSPNPLYLDTLGWLHYRLGEPAHAVEVLKKAAEADMPVIHYHLGMALRGAGDNDAALAHLKKAASATADFPGRNEARALAGAG